MEKFTAVFEQDGDWWIGYLEELPGANTQGRTLAEARENLKDAVRLLIAANGVPKQELGNQEWWDGPLCPPFTFTPGRRGGLPHQP